MYIFQKELSHTREQLINEISSLCYAEFNEQVTKKEWSIAQVCHHLVLSELLFTKGLTIGLSKNENIPVNEKKIHTLKDRSFKVDAPEIVQPELIKFELQQILELLNDSRKKLVNVLRSVHDSSIWAEKSAKHPVFKEVSLEQWIEIIFLHEQRHIQQIEELKTKIYTAN
ncbi:DinB family protein [Bacillus sp. JJ722]|uniref:DinB family protein n=1 Tax=Bacillus sp. JJ722 TaxID=3122973 RepID=UPI003000A4F7